MFNAICLDFNDWKQLIRLEHWKAKQTIVQLHQKNGKIIYWFFSKPKHNFF